MPTLLSLPRKWLCSLQSPIQKSNVTRQVCEVFTRLLGRTCHWVPITFSRLPVTALARAYHICLNSWLILPPSTPIPPLLLTSDHLIWVDGGVSNFFPSHLVGNTWIPVPPLPPHRGVLPPRAFLPFLVPLSLVLSDSCLKMPCILSCPQLPLLKKDQYTHPICNWLGIWLSKGRTIEYQPSSHYTAGTSEASAE